MCIYHILTAIQRISTDRNPAINITKVGWSADEIHWESVIIGDICMI